MADVIDSRNIRVFISSTFRDMEAERNELVSKAFPLLKKMARERQVTVSEIDLRWGITEKESQESKVVQICLEEIDRSHPFFIGVLGGRYGWCPKDEDVDWHKIIPPKYADAVSDIYEGRSMTELEVRHGVFRNKKNLYAAFYLRDLPIDKIEPKQQILRNLVDSQNDFPVHKYKDIDELTKYILEDFQKLLDQLYPLESCNTWESLCKRQNYFLERLTRYYVTNVEAESNMSEFLEQETGKGLLIIGDSGIGKSTLMAKVFLNLKKKADVEVLSFFPANSSNGSTFNDLTDWFCQGFSALYGFDYNRDVSHIAEFQRAAATIRPTKKLVLFIDGINQIVPTDDIDNDMSWWPSWHPNVYVVFSTPSDSVLIKNLARFQFKSIEVRPFDLDQRVELSNRFLKGGFNKSLSLDQLEIIGRTNPLFSNTLAFILFLDEIRRFGSFEMLTEEMSRLSSFMTIGDFFEYIITQQKNHYTTKNLAEKYEGVLSTIALSYRGVSEDDLISLTGISRLDLSTILGMNELNLSEKDGRIVFAHESFRKAVISLFLNTKDKVATIRKSIIKYMNNQENGEEKLLEIAYQYYELECFDKLFLHLSNMRSYAIFSSNGKLKELGHYWSELLKVNPYRYDILSIIYNEMGAENNAMMMEAMFYVVVSIQSQNILTLSHFVSNNIRNPQAGKRLTNALIKMLENEHEGGYDELRDAAKQITAVSNRLEGNLISALKQYSMALENSPDMADATVSNVGELFLSLYEQNGNKTYAEYALQILKEVLEARIRKYGTEDHEEVALAYANYASAVFVTNPDYGIELEKKSLAIFEKLKGYYNIDVAIQYGNIARTVLETNPEESIAFAENALEIYNNLLGKDADDTLMEHWSLALAYKNNNDFVASWQHARVVSDFRCNKQGKRNDFLVFLKLLLADFYKNSDYEHAAEVGLHAISIIGEDSASSALFHDDLGKVYHVMGEREKSERHYEKAIELHIKNNQFEKAQYSLCYYSQIYFAYGEYDKAQHLLQRIIEINERNNLDESLILAYAYYNIGLSLYGHKNDRDGAVEFINRAIQIREGLVDEDEDDLVEYKSTLEKILANGSVSIDATGENSRHAIEVFASILGETAPQALEAFMDGVKAFDSGNIDQASHMLKIAQSCLDDNAPKSAKAQIVRYLAYCDEMVYSHTNGRKGEPSDIFAQYETARMLAEVDENYLLAAEICHDVAMFCSGLNYYGSSEICYWRKFENILSADSFMSIDASYTLYNILMVANRKGGLEAETALAIVSLSLYIYDHIDEEDVELKKILDEHYQTIVDMIDESDLIPKDECGLHIWTLISYVRKLKEYDSERLPSNLLWKAMGYFKETEKWNAFSIAYLHYINSLLNMSEYAKAMQEMEILIQEYVQYLDDENQNNAVNIFYILAIALHNFDQAEFIREKCSISEETMQNYMQLYTPCYFALLNKDEEKAEKLYLELKCKQEDDNLAENQYYDMALYCASKKRIYEGKRYMALWRECIINIPSDYQQYYKPAITKLQNLLN